MKYLIIYSSATGFTKKYVDMIKQNLNCDTMMLNDIKDKDLSGYEKIIYGAGIYAGKLNKYDSFIKIIKAKKIDKEIIIFATGAEPYSEDTIVKLKENNNIEVTTFYFPAGINYDRMTFVHKMMMKMMMKMMKKIKDKSEENRKAYERVKNSFDVCDNYYIEPLINYLSLDEK